MKSDYEEIVFNGNTYQMYREKVDLTQAVLSPYRQRTFSLTHAQAMARPEVYNPFAVRIIYAERPDGSRGMVGGQHCCWATIANGITEKVVEIVKVSSKEQEKQLCRDLNNHKKVVRKDALAEKLADGDPLLTRLVDVMSCAGRPWSHTNRGQGKGDWYKINSLDVIAQIDAKYGESGLLESLLHGKRWWYGQSQAGSSDVLVAAALFIHEYRTEKGTFPGERAGEILSKVPLKDVLTRTKAGTDNYSGGHWKKGELIARVLASIYNENKGDRNHYLRKIGG